MSARPDVRSVPAELRSRHHALGTGGPPPGPAWCRAWSDALDDALRRLASGAPAAGRLTVAAVGGYGRREACPGSDVDLLLLHDGWSHDALEAAVRAVVYPLWDAGLKVGYAVRDPGEAVAATADLDAATALLDGRPLAGDTDLLRAAQASVTARLHRRPGRFLEALTDADRRRRARAGDAAEALEPDLKNGAGGLRDVQSLRWAAAALVGAPGLDPLVSSRYLGAADRHRLAVAYDRLLAERVALHLAEGRGRDVLVLDAHPDVAARLGHRDGDDERDTAAHRLLTAHYLAARTVDHVHRRAWTLIAADAGRGRRLLRRAPQRQVDGFGLVDGALMAPDHASVDQPDLPVRLFEVLTREEAVLDRRTAERLRRRVQQGGPFPWRWTDRLRRRFVATLWRGAPALPALAELDDVGLLTVLAPELAPARGRAQRNPFHRYSLDRHGWHTAAELAELVRREPWAAATLEGVLDREGLMLGAFLHDLGKAYGEPHSQTGVPVARAVAARMGASPTTVEFVGRLVELHLLLPDVASRRDLSDPSLLRAVAKEVGDRDLLASLHLLAAADGAATGPTAWTSWKADLVESLVTKVRAILDDIEPDELADAAAATAEEAQRLAPELGADAGDVRAHLASLPTRYADAVPPRAVVRHTLMARAALEPHEIRTRVTPGPEDAAAPLDELDVVARDAPGLFATVAGALALHDGSILAAHAFTRDDGVAIDSFTVRRPEDATGSWWARVEGDLAEAAAGRLALRARLDRKGRARARRRPSTYVIPTTVTAHEDPSGRATLLEVRTADRVGVLFAITSALAELRLDIVLAKIQTIGHEVVDVFYVTDADGAALDDDHLAEARLAVTAALGAGE